MSDNKESSKKRTFRKFSYRGVDLEGLIDLDFEKVRKAALKMEYARFVLVSELAANHSARVNWSTRCYLKWHNVAPCFMFFCGMLWIDSQTSPCEFIIEHLFALFA